MKREEMSPQNLADRRTFIGMLSTAGWEVQDWDEVLNLGGDVQPEAEATHLGPVFAIRIEYQARGRYLIIELADHVGAHHLRLHLHPTGDIGVPLSKVTSVQDSLDMNSYPDLVKSLVPVSDPLLVEADDTLYKLS